MNQSIQLAIVDDSPMIVELLADYLEQQDHIHVCCKTFGGNPFLKALETDEVRPNTVLLDLQMADGDGIMTLEVLHKKYPSFHTIVMSSFYKPAYLGHMLKIGANAFIPKDIEKEELVNIVYEVDRKGHYFMPEQLEVMRKQLSRKVPEVQLDQRDVLSEREIEVLKLLCEQCTAKEIAEKLFVSQKTVEAHKSNLLSKTGAKNTAGLIIYAVQKRIIIPDEMVMMN